MLLACVILWYILQVALLYISSLTFASISSSMREERGGGEGMRTGRGVWRGVLEGYIVGWGADM